MARFNPIAIGLLLFFYSSVAQAQPPAGIKEIMDKTLILEKEGKFRAAYGEWAKFLKAPALTNKLADENIQKVYFTSYFFLTRALYRTALHDKGIKDRQKLITGAAQSILKLEFSKSQEGWKIAGRMFEEFWKEAESEQLKKAYDKLKSERN